MRRWLSNCFWLMLPVLAISTLFAGRLPAAFQTENFWHEIPAGIALPENLFRILITGLPLLLPLGIAMPRQRLGWAVYAAGVLAYGLAWWPLIAAPTSGWSTSLAGFAAPAYTPVLWLAGIGLIGFRNEPDWRRWASWSFIAAAMAFLAWHNLHTLLVWSRQI